MVKGRLKMNQLTVKHHEQSVKIVRAIHKPPLSKAETMKNLEELGYEG